MEYGACNVIYIDRRAQDEHVRRDTLSNSLAARTSRGSFSPEYFSLGKHSLADVHANIEVILLTFNEVHVCRTGASCLSKLSKLLDTAKSDIIPILVLIDIPYDEERRLKRLSREPRTPSPTSTRHNRLEVNELDDIYGKDLLKHIASEIQSKNLSRLVVPVAILSGLDHDSTANDVSSPSGHGSHLLTDTVRLVRYLDAGASDVFSSPLSKDNVQSLAIQAYKVHKEVYKEETGFLIKKRNRKLSWVGVDDTKPFAYLREAMVSNLMGGICNPETIGDSLDPSDVDIDPAREDQLAAAIGSWSFSAHDFTDDELLYGALLMLKHALSMRELEKWRMDDEDLIIFLMASRTAYNDFVLYHNFRHVVDVLQALFFSLLQIGILPQYGHDRESRKSSDKPAIAQLLKPFDALTLLISAIGHDVGHPGVNNAFLVQLNAPLAQLYNDRSVLESFHCAAYSQILRRYWPVAFEDTAMRKLMINSILATDMGLHFKYMADLGNIQQKLAHDSGGADAWSVKVREEYKELTCGLLIKCADISNVARKFDTAARWATILTDEFSNQGVMEQELGIPTCLFGGPPVLDDLIKLGESQIGFMNIFAQPLFEAVADVLPAMRFSVEEILTNKLVWQRKIEQEKQSRLKRTNMNLGMLMPSFASDPSPSPLSGGPVKLPHETKPSGLRMEHTSPSASHGAAIPTRIPLSEDSNSNRRSSSSSHLPAASGSRRSSLAPDRGSRRSSAVGVPGGRSFASIENQSQSRRGSGDASITAILVTQTPNSADRRSKEALPEPQLRSVSPTKHNEIIPPSPPKGLGRPSPKESTKDNVRPMTAPSSARCAQSKTTYPSHMPSNPGGPGPNSELALGFSHMNNNNSSQSHSEIDLSQISNGNLDGSRVQKWNTGKQGDASNLSKAEEHHEPSSKGDWWRMGHKRRTRDWKINANDNYSQADNYSQNKEIFLSPVTTDTNSSTVVCPSPDKSRSGKFRNFFRRRPKEERQTSTYSNQTPPTSDPGQSVTSED